MNVGRLLIFVVLAAPGACAAFTGEDPRRDVEAPVVPAPPGPDGGVAPSPDAVAPPLGLTSCPAGAFYCEHFTERSTVVADMGTLVRQGDPALSLVGTLGAPDRALRFLSPVGGVKRQAELTRELASPPPASLTVSFTVTSATAARVHLVNFFFHADGTATFAPSDHQVYLRAQSGALQLAEYREAPSLASSQVVGDLGDGLSHRVVMTIELASGVARARLDGRPESVLQLQGPRSALGYRFGYGMWTDASWTGPDVDLVFDDVLLQ